MNACNTGVSHSEVFHSTRRTVLSCVQHVGDILAEIKQQKEELSSFVDNKIKTLQAEIHGSNLAVASDIKKLKSESEIEWKFKDNKIHIAELSSQVEWAIKNDKREYALELLKEVGEKLKERNKHLRIADSSPGGLGHTSDSKDDSKINRAENKAFKKRKLSKPNKGKDRGNFSTTAPNAVFNSISSDVVIVIGEVTQPLCPGLIQLFSFNNKLMPGPFVSEDASTAGTLRTSGGNVLTCPLKQQHQQLQLPHNENKVQLEIKEFLKDEYNINSKFEMKDRYEVYQNDISILPDALKEKVKMIPDIIKYSKADSTTVGYYRGFKKWSDWVKANGLQKNDALPAKPIVVGLIQNGSSVSTLTNAFYSINWAHKVIDVPSPLDSELVRNVFDAGKRQLSVPKITGSNAIT
ncbi:LOW QUALITY PROTEIN: hypothetical protein KUTeg_009735 [Tegillarca granosa]|uniref:Uncharacterized protein n=1 Tax=Tegillarca granosa TaxID=220873 RepID=A0ABQ9F7W0_TEGGR|nr:LOW QUALITY PROTEIN: hypothetical protein KUTeg_009735 [Tegillarca granosa]